MNHLALPTASNCTPFRPARRAVPYDRKDDFRPQRLPRPPIVSLVRGGPKLKLDDSQIQHLRRAPALAAKAHAEVLAAKMPIIECHRVLPPRHRHLRRSPDRGNASAMRLLSDLYRHGYYGVPLDVAAADCWDEADAETHVLPLPCGSSGRNTLLEAGSNRNVWIHKSTRTQPIVPQSLKSSRPPMGQ
jgi:hypothetical protein